MYVNPVYEDIFVRYFKGEILPDEEYKWIIRFRKKYREGKQSSCWNWNGTIDTRGYGMYAINGQHGVKLKRCPRLSYCLYRGEIGKDGYGRDLEVCHTCDNPKCLNRFHLFLGTQSDNMKNRAQKNRYKTQLKGSNHARARFTKKQVEDIKKSYFSGEMDQYQLAAKYKVLQSYISYIINQKTYTPLNADGSKDVSQIKSNQGRKAYKLRKQAQYQKLSADRVAGMSY